MLLFVLKYSYFQYDKLLKIQHHNKESFHSQSSYTFCDFKSEHGERKIIEIILLLEPNSNFWLFSQFCMAYHVNISILCLNYFFGPPTCRK